MKIGDEYSPVTMGYGFYLVIEDRIKIYTGISWDAKAVLAQLLWYSRSYKQDVVFIKQEKLIEDLGMNRGKVQRAIKELIDDKWIKKDNPEGKERLLHYYNKYHFIIHPVQIVKPADVHPEAHMCAPGSTDVCSQYNNTNSNNTNSKIVSNETITIPNGIVCTPAPSQSALIREKLKLNKNKNKNKLIKKNKPITPKLNNELAEEIFHYWEANGLNVGNEGTKIRFETIEKLNALTTGLLPHGDPCKFWKGTDFDSIAPPEMTIDKIKTAIDRFILFNRFKKGTNYSLSKFIFEPRATTIRGRSLLIYYLKNDPGEQLREDKHPVLTTALKKEYERTVLGGRKRKYTVADCNCFILAAEKATKFYNKNKNSLTFGDFCLPNQIAECMMECIVAVCPEVNKIAPSWFCSEKQFEQRLPAYLYDQGIFREQRKHTWSIYDMNR